MAKSFGESAKQLLEILAQHGEEEQVRLLQGAAVMLGVAAPTTPSAGYDNSSATGGRGGSTDSNTEEPATFFANKKPTTKQEELAVAARFRENRGNETHTKEDLQEIFRRASINFDSNNFNRDVDNARRAGLFLKGKELELSYNGKQFVDLLPDREKANEFKKKAVAKRGAKKAAKRPKSK
ncbi:MAG: hypothetical protein KF757_02180 [Phycisphaeraceae bacterium]|nr:hypothetical protein [Phycisphaeraceae bacterium]MCW5762020.1 hypothetical protein [Phycisphaeraceae bacterium]